MSSETAADAILGFGDWRYQAVPDWPQMPDDIGFVEAIGVAAGRQDQIYVFNRGNPPVLVFEADGQFRQAWGEDFFVRPHGMTAAADDTLYLTDDLGHRVAQFTVEGKLLRNIGPSGVPSDTGVLGFDYRTVDARGPYNLPTNAAIANDGHVFVADGYGNASIHHFDTEGRLVQSWGSAGDAEGQFNVPHGICVDSRNRVLVADRENSRIQVFDRNGSLLQVWTDVVRPCQVVAGGNESFFVAELGNQNGRFPWQSRPDQPIGGRVSVFDGDGNLLSRWGGGLESPRFDRFYACHDVCVDSRDSIYVGEVSVTVATAAGEGTTGLRSLSKFERV